MNQYCIASLLLKKMYLISKEIIRNCKLQRVLVDLCDYNKKNHSILYLALV